MSTITTSRTTSCPRCQRGGVTIGMKHPVCPPCQAAPRQEAARQQERDYLAQYLATRDDDHGREATMLLFDARVAALMARYGAGNKRGRPARHAQGELDGRERASHQRMRA